MATYSELLKKILIDTVRIANEANTWPEHLSKLPYAQKLAAVANSLNTDCTLAKNLVSAALEDMVIAKLKSIGYLSKEFVKTTYAMITYHESAPAKEKEQLSEALTLSAISAAKVKLSPESSHRLKVFFESAREGESTVVPFSLYEQCDLDTNKVAEVVAKEINCPQDELAVYVSPVEPNVIREKMEYYGHRPWVITPDLPIVVVEKVEPISVGTC